MRLCAVLSAYGLEEVQKVLGLSDDDVVNLLLDDCEVWSGRSSNGMRST